MRPFFFARIGFPRQRISFIMYKCRHHVKHLGTYVSPRCCDKGALHTSGTSQMLKFSALPPVRRPVPLRRASSTAHGSLSRFFNNRSITLCASGTAALSQALARCATRLSAQTPEAIIPAYGCPDLVAACMHASIYPRLADIDASGWSYDLDDLSRKLSADTVAIVSVNLMGIADGTPCLSDLCRQRGITLIQDSAQFLPRNPIDWPADYVILSFGRGKPMNLLHGGALIAPPESPPEPTPKLTRYTLRDRLRTGTAAALAFNFLTRPHPYWIVSHLPGSGLGTVTYKPLSNPAALPPSASVRVDAAFAQYQRQQTYSRHVWAASIAEWTSFGIRPLQPDTPSAEPEPLRLLLLAPDRASRDDLVIRLQRAGLGASHLYGADLAHVSGIPDEVRHQGTFPHAAALAERLFTLPTHAFVTPRIVRETTDCIRKWHRAHHRG